MGFSVSGATVLVFVGVFIGFGVFYTAAANGVSQVTNAYQENGEHLLSIQNTDFEIVSTTYSSPTLTVEANNTGATTLRVDQTDLLVDNAYQNDVTTDVDGNTGTEVWQPGETLTFQVDLGSAPNRVKVVTKPGVARTEQV